MPIAIGFIYLICSKRKKPHTLYALLIFPKVFPATAFQHFVIYD